MKRFIAFLITLLMICGSAICEDVATPTDLIEEDLIEIEDDDWGKIEITFERKVYISMDKEPEYLGDTMTLVATLVDFQPEDCYTIYWQYSPDQNQWHNIDGEHQQTVTITIDKTNYKNWWRVLVELEG